MLGSQPWGYRVMAYIVMAIGGADARLAAMGLSTMISAPCAMPVVTGLHSHGVFSDGPALLRQKACRHGSYTAKVGSWLAHLSLSKHYGPRGLSSVGLSSVGLSSDGLSSVDLCNADLSSVGLCSVGVSSVGPK